MTSSAIMLRDALAAFLDQPHARVLCREFRRADDILRLPEDHHRHHARFFLRQMEVRHLQLVVVDLRSRVVVHARVADLVVNPRRNGVDDVFPFPVFGDVLVRKSEVKEMQRLRAFDRQLGADRFEIVESFDVVT